MHLAAGVFAWITNLDHSAFRLINGELASPWLDHIMLVATMLGVGVVQAGMSLGFVVAGWFCDKVQLRRAGYAGLTAFALSGIAVQIAKHIWDRPRPLLAMFDVRIVDGPLFSHSFPSGHTTTAFAVAFACAAFLPKWRWFFALLAFSTAVSRVYLGVHFPIDVAYGGLIGALVSCASATLIRLPRWNKPSDKEIQAEIIAE